MPIKERVLLIPFSTRLYIETDDSLRRIQMAMDRSISLTLRTIIRNYENNLKHRFTQDEWEAFLAGNLDREAFTAAATRGKRLPTRSLNGSGHAGDDWRDK